MEEETARLQAEFNDLLHSRSAEPKEKFWTTESGQTDGFYEMMTDFYSSNKHEAPTTRLVKQKDNAWESKHTMRKSMAGKP